MKIQQIALLALCLAQVSPLWSATVYVNQVGYDSEFPKKAVVEGPANMAGSSFQVKQNGTTIFTGTLSTAQSISTWTYQPYFTADFSSLTTPGSYKIYVTVNSVTDTSRTFTIGTNAITDATLGKVLGYFLQDRADRSDVWAKDAAIGKFEDYSGKTYNVRGGWFDAAGDVSKYLSHLSYANYLNPQQTPMTVWALAFVKERIPALLSAKGLTNNVQQEALWGADFLMRMLDPAGYFYITIFDKWTGNMYDRQISAFYSSEGIKTADYKAAFREGGGMSIAALARVSTWGIKGDSSSAAYLAAAVRAYSHLKQKTVSGYCEYCDDYKENTIDEYTALMAAIELYNATQNNSYLTDAQARVQTLIGRLSPAGYFFSDAAKTRPFWHAAEAGLPLVALTRYLEVVAANAADRDQVKAAIQTHLNYLKTVTANTVNPFGYARQTFESQDLIQDGFFIPHDNESGYWWQGENARLASLAAAAFYAGRVVAYDQAAPGKVDASLSSYGYDQLHWILGRNPKDICFFEGVGQVNPPSYPGANLKAGHLVGGIVNGITGSATNGSGLTFQTGSNFEVGQEWQSWRWIEQWLPHSTWFLMALAAKADEFPPAPVRVAQPTQETQSADLYHAVAVNGALQIQFAKVTAQPMDLRIMDLQGRVVFAKTLNAGQSQYTVALPGMAHGVHALLLAGKSVRVIL